MKAARKVLIAPGIGLLALAAAMLVFVLITWGITTPLPPTLDLIGQISFYGFIPTGLVGCVLLVIGSKLSPPSSPAET